LMRLPLAAGLAFVIVMAAPLEVAQGTSAACRWDEWAALSGQVVRTASRLGFCVRRAQIAQALRRSTWGIRLVAPSV